VNENIPTVDVAVGMASDQQSSANDCQVGSCGFQNADRIGTERGARHVEISQAHRQGLISVAC
jgi:hypothetical protein